MPKYIATWDIGYGEQATVIEAKDEEDARKQTYELALELQGSTVDTRTGRGVEYR